MTTTIMSGIDQRKLRASDPRLPLVASQAAIEFDNAIQGKVVEFKSAKRLAKFLEDSFEQPVGYSVKRLSLDTSTAGIIGHALNNSSCGVNIRTIEEVVEKAYELVESIKKIPTSDDQNFDQLRLKELRAFCVAFGNTLVAYRNSLQDFRPFSTYRR